VRICNWFFKRRIGDTAVASSDGTLTFLRVFSSVWTLSMAAWVRRREDKNKSLLISVVVRPGLKLMPLMVPISPGALT
jgi:hypothetical protein